MIYILISFFASIIYPILIVTAMKGKAIAFRGILSCIVVYAFVFSTGIVMLYMVRG